MRVLSLIGLALPTLLLLSCTTTPRKPPTVEGLTDGITLRIGDDPVALATRLYTVQGPAERMVRVLIAAEKGLQNDPQDAQAAFLACRACFWLADWRSDHASSLPKSSVYARKGVAFGEWGRKIAPQRADLHYYCALNMGLVLKYAGIGALFSLDETVALLETARSLDESYDQGGPLRVLGKIYLKAPAWPTGIGDLDKALQYLKQAVRKYPGHPLNHLFLAEALYEDGALQEARERLAQAGAMLQPERYGWYAARWQANIEQLSREIK